jgi:D-glycero-alpha-D-manno-heptose-7-phosphate kinase
MIISRTPHRVSFFGGGSDYPTWYRDHGGAVLVSAIDKHVYVTMRELPPFFEHKTRVVWSKVELVGSNLDIENPAVRGTLEYFNKPECGLEVHYQSDLPARSGMGSSSAFIVGLLNAHWGLTSHVKQLAADQMSLAKTAVRIEQEYVGDTVGVQDQYASALGGINLLLINRDGVPIVRMCDPECGAELEKKLLLVFTGFSRHASEIAKAQVAEMGDHKAAMYEIMEQAIEGRRILTGRAPLSDFPQLLKRAWEIKKKFSSLITNQSLNYIVDGLLANGAGAAKIIGAGGGGFVLLWVIPSNRSGVIEWATSQRLIPVPFQFNYTGSEIILRELPQAAAAS